MKPPQIHTVRFVDLGDLPNHEALMDCDLKLTIGEGMSIYSCAESLAEISRHHDASETDSDFSEMMRIIQNLPDDVQVCW